PVSRRVDGAVSQLRATAARMAAPVATSPAKTAVRTPARRAAASRPAKAGGGFALDMSEGDERDADFTRSA
ncbi:hypothetical protein SQ03_10540, partial [Methylobacterium platani JCM 14648]